MPDNKKELSEQEIRSRFISPALTQAGWDLHTQIREELHLTDGRILVRGESHARGERKRADYVLYHKPNIPIAIVEAKDNNHEVGDGLQQALDYAEMLDVPFAFSSNGDGFLEHDRTGQRPRPERNLSMTQFPPPAELWQRYCTWKGLSAEHQPLVTHDFHDGRKTLRYYQELAVNRTVQAIAKGQNRILLVMATGTGKTFTAFHIIWRLWKARAKKRILFLADRNILVDQTRTNDFKPFGQAMTKITNRRIDTSFEIYLALYQAITGDNEEDKAYKKFSPGFFDLIVIDECHRGSAKEDSAWREILEYFSSATQIGMTATPKETKYISNIEYFGKPVYTYSLKQGIDDGFLAPYKVVRIDLDKDLTGWRPERGRVDDKGQPIEDRIYNQSDFDKSLVLTKRTELVAKKVTEFLKATDRYQKTIVFCEDIDHAERMRQALVNENGDLAAENRKYIMRITGDEAEGKAELDNFINPESRYPVIATTSKLLSTGVDTKTVKLVVLDSRINSMTEFKQIIGRGSRIDGDFNKFYFTIMDFKKATTLFADPDFDGDPVQIYEPGPGGSPVPPEEPKLPGDPPEPPGHRTKYVVGNVGVSIVSERHQYFDKDGKLITESLRDYTRASVKKEFASLDEFLKHWDEAERKETIIEEIRKQGIPIEGLSQEVGKDLDPFDLICHVVYDRPPLTRRERAARVRKGNYFDQYEDKARAVLSALLEKYADRGIENIESMDILRVPPLNGLGTPMEILNAFGGRDGYLKAIHQLEHQLYFNE